MFENFQEFIQFVLNDGPEGDLLARLDYLIYLSVFFLTLFFQIWG